MTASCCGAAPTAIHVTSAVEACAMAVRRVAAEYAIHNGRARPCVRDESTADQSARLAAHVAS